MSFVDWATGLALLIVTIGGAYGGLLAVTRRKVDVPPYKVEGGGALLLALVYFGGAAVALVALVLLLLSRFS
jgi:hypothetical protein